MSFRILILFALVALMQSSVSNALKCYQCKNFEVTGSLSPFTGKLDPNCGRNPTSSNVVTCSGDDNACGSIEGEFTADFSIFGKLTGKAQVLTCMKVDESASPLGSCRKMDALSKKIITDALSAVTAGVADVEVNGQVCACGFDLCVMCDGGYQIGDYCMKYWMIAVIGVGSLLLLVLSITCCCCCCGCCGCCCCKNKQRGTVLSRPGQYQVLTVSSGDVSRNQQYAAPPQHYAAPPQHYASPHMGASGLSVQSGDIRGIENPAVQEFPLMDESNVAKAPAYYP